MRSQVWKLFRRFAELKFSYRFHSVKSAAAEASQTAAASVRTPLSSDQTDDDAHSHILFLAGDVAALKLLLRRDTILPVRTQRLRCASVVLSRPRDLQALAVMRSMKESIESGGVVSQRSSKVLAFTERESFGPK